MLKKHNREFSTSITPLKEAAILGEAVVTVLQIIQQKETDLYNLDRDYPRPIRPRL